MILESVHGFPALALPEDLSFFRCDCKFLAGKVGFGSHFTVAVYLYMGHQDSRGRDRWGLCCVLIFLEERTVSYVGH